jgi:phosphonate transport system substrate-binding protein
MSRQWPVPKIMFVWMLSLGALLLFACQSEAAQTVSLTQNVQQGEVAPPIPQKTAVWQIGFDRRLEPKEDVRQIASLTNWLETKTGLPLEIVVTPRGSTVVDDLCSGKVDFAVVGTVSYLQARHRCGASILVRGINAEGDDIYQAAIVVPVDSPLTAVLDLAGQSFAFGSANSTQGYLIPRLMMQQEGLELSDLQSYAFHDSHAATANAVTSGRFDAGGLQDVLALDLAERGLVRILALSEPFPSSSVVVGPHVPVETAVLIQNALLQLDPTGADASALYRWERSEMPGGFGPAADSDYDDLSATATTIGLLEP